MSHARPWALDERTAAARARLLEALGGPDWSWGFVLVARREDCTGTAALAVITPTDACLLTPRMITALGVLALEGDLRVVVRTDDDHAELRDVPAIYVDVCSAPYGEMSFGIHSPSTLPEHGLMLLSRYPRPPSGWPR